MIIPTTSGLSTSGAMGERDPAGSEISIPHCVATKDSFLSGTLVESRN